MRLREAEQISRPVDDALCHEMGHALGAALHPALDQQQPCRHDLAPKALGVYMGGERGQLEGEYFTPDAAGLDIPASSIAPQPLPETEFTGFPVSTGRRVATCAVSTGLEASWVLDYTLTDDGWRCAAVKGPLEGGYRVHEGKPEEQK